MRFSVIVVVFVAAIFWHSSPVSAQRRMMRPFNPVDGRVTTEIDRGVRQAMNEAQQLIKDRQFVPAVHRLQSILDFPEDYFLQKDFKDTKAKNQGVKAQTHQILAELPAEGRSAYQLHYGPSARALFDDAMQSNDVEKMCNVVSRYKTTSSGFEAMQIIAASALDRDQPMEAARLLEAMASHPNANADMAGSLLLQAGFAWHLAGQMQNSEATLAQLKALDVPSAWKIRGRPIQPLLNESNTSEWMSSTFGPSLPIHREAVRDWAMPRGGLSGNESARNAYPIGGGAWIVSNLEYAKFHSVDEANQKRKQAFNQLANQIERTLRDSNRLAQPAAIPIVVGDLVVYRTLNDITAVDLNSGTMKWRSSVTDGMLAWLFQSTTSDANQAASSLPTTFPGFVRHKLFLDQLSGSLTSDGRSVFAVEESDSQFVQLRVRPRQQLFGPYIADPANKLVAYDLEGGRLMWEIGGPRGTPPVELSGVFFLGPPIPFEGKLYCLAEVKDELCLLALTPEGSSVRLDWSQSLIGLFDGNAIGQPRRLAGVVPAVAEGMMICPTSSGSIVAFDLVQHQLQWGYSYDAKRSSGFAEGFELPVQVDDSDARWLDAGPVIANGRVIVTPRDSSEIHCLNLIDGTLAWKRQRDQGLYVASVNRDVVVVVGRTHVNGYLLTDGSEVWAATLENAEPSGRGVRIGSRYLLPLTTGEIATIDMMTGKVLGRSSLEGGSIPGNLSAGSGAVVSQGLHNITGFRKLPELETQIAGLQNNPHDAKDLALRGELRIHHGEESDAINDLRESLRLSPDSRVKRVLAGTLLTATKHDFLQLIKSASELESLTDDPRQRIEFLRLYAKALNEAGDRVGSVNQLFRLATAPLFTDEKIESEPGYFISFEQSIRSQLLTAYGTADANDRQKIERAFESEFAASLASQDKSERLARFVKLTLGHPAAEPTLKRLVELETSDVSDSVQTQVLERLARSPSESTAGFAVATLAARALATQNARNALPWIQGLAESFPTQICLQGKTGGQLSDDWLARDDIRRSQIPAAVWPSGDIGVERSRERNVAQSSYPVDVVTRVGHHFAGWSFEIDSIGGVLTARNPSMRIAWRLPLDNPFENMGEAARILPSQLHIRGRKMAFSQGLWFCVMESTDIDSMPTILFRKSLRSNSFFERRMRDQMERRPLLPNGRRFQPGIDARNSAGFLIGLSDEAVFYQLDNQLIAIDAESDRFLWSRMGPQFAKFDATVDKTLTLHTNNNEAILFRPMDGTLLQKHKGRLDELPLWFRGTQRLSKRAVDPEQQVFELHDFDGDTTVWQSQHPAGSQSSVIDDDEFAIVEPSGKLTVFKIRTGEAVLNSEIPTSRPHGSGGVLAVQRFNDSYIVVAGISSKKNDAANIVPLASETSFTIDGCVCAVDKNNGHVRWTVPVEKLAFDHSQPAKLPILALASRQTELDQFGRFGLSSILVAMILDKRTGRLVYETREALLSTTRPPQFVPMIEERKLIVDFQGWNLVLTFPNPQ